MDVERAATAIGAVLCQDEHLDIWEEIPDRLSLNPIKLFAEDYAALVQFFSI